MFLERPFEGLSLQQLSERCATESNLFFNRKAHDPRFCYELFRRAIVEKDNLAWEAVHFRYARLVRGWVERHSLLSACEEDGDFLVNEAFAKMWAAIPPSRFATFPDLKSLLRYLQLCVGSVITDCSRAREIETEPLEEWVESQSTAPDGERAALDNLHRQELWDYLRSQMKNEQEFQVLWFSFVLGMKPAEIAEHAPQQFPQVDLVYSLKENILTRLERDEQLAQLTGRYRKKGKSRV